AKAAVKADARHALTVGLVTPQTAEWSQTLAANGNIAAWQEAVIGAELSGLRVTEVLVNVGDAVKRGQPLAKLATDAILADLAQARASVTEAEAALAEAKANADRSKQLQSQGFISPQATIQVLTAEQTTAARLAAARARVQAEEVRLAQARILAPDDGVISARNATVGSLTQPNQELFRLIRGGRLEWRAEVTGTELTKLAPGVRATLTTASGVKVEGTVRAVAPSVDPATRNGIVYVDLPASGAVRAGTFARGEFELGRGGALTLPQSAVVLRDGFTYVFLVGADNKVVQSKVEVGRRLGDRIEVVAGLPPSVRVVETGGGFLADGDTVRVVEAAAAPVKSAQK
ncbi:MAG: efflux RND transporter periplasmic adaptor subunit, partial [Betaproteobacteria bacterium]